MNNEYEVYKFSINTLENVLNSVEKSFRNYNNTINDSYSYIKEIRKNINKLKENLEIPTNKEEISEVSLEDATNKLRGIIIDSCNKITNIVESSKILLTENNENIQDEDIVIFNYLTKLLNESFWESRYQVSKLGIKYPSNLYEKTVKEYQNKYLIEKSNITLEELKNKIEYYKEKLENK